MLGAEGDGKLVELMLYRSHALAQAKQPIGESLTVVAAGGAGAGGWGGVAADLSLACP